MAEDDTDREDELDAERDAEIEDELKRIDRNPDEVDDGDLGTQNAPRSDTDDDEIDERSSEATDEPN
ncbi:hypothetical protein OB905_06325 [Halobacteria archaeon AArc-dxtr1]|nr:hypothetical protein [Halobacteria archaeon AArc-dxtr1]